MLSPGFNIIMEKDKFYGISDAYSLEETHLPLHYKTLSYDVVANFIKRVHYDKTLGSYVWDINQRPINSMPTQLQIVKKLLRANVRFTKEYVKFVIEEYDDTINKLTENRRQLSDQLQRDWSEGFIHQISNERREWSLVLKNFSYKRTGDAPINEQDVTKAKDYPMTSLLKFNSQGFACCPWHNERTPSLKYYKQTNTVHCFGCGKSGDTIEVVKGLYGESFIQAVRRLAQ